MYYFAYGSNLNHKQMQTRCPESHFIERVRLDGHKFVYDGYAEVRKGAVGNILESPEDIVWGGLYEVMKNDLRKLDAIEGYPTVYQRKEVVVENDAGKIKKALAYYRIGETEGRPSEEYRKVILEGVKDCNLPNEYVEKYL